MILNRAVHLKAVKGHSLLQALNQLMTELHFPLISLTTSMLALKPKLWLKHLSFPDQHLNVKANRTAWQNWPCVIISPKLSLTYVYRSFQRQSRWGQRYKPVFRHGNLQEEKTTKLRSDCTAGKGEQKPGKEGTSYSKVPGACTRKIFNKGIRRTISLKGKED